MWAGGVVSSIEYISCSIVISGRENFGLRGKICPRNAGCDNSA